MMLQSAEAPRQGPNCHLLCKLGAGKTTLIFLKVGPGLGEKPKKGTELLWSLGQQEEWAQS